MICAILLSQDTDGLCAMSFLSTRNTVPFSKQSDMENVEPVPAHSSWVHLRHECTHWCRLLRKNFLPCELGCRFLFFIPSTMRAFSNLPNTPVDIALSIALTLMVCHLPVTNFICFSFNFRDRQLCSYHTDEEHMVICEHPHSNNSAATSSMQLCLVDVTTALCHLP